MSQQKLPQNSKNSILNLLIRISSTGYDEILFGEITKYVNTESRWNYLYTIASRNGMLPKLFSIIKNNIEDIQIPFPVRNLITQNFYANVGRNALLKNEVREITELLKENELNLILLKGISNIYRFEFYESHRVLSDIDLLFDRHQALKAWDLIHDLQYESPPFMSAWHKKNFQLVLRHLPPLYRGQFNIDVNWNLFFGLLNGIELTELAIDMADTSDDFRLLSPEIQLLHSIYHLNEHWQKNELVLKWYSDLLIILKHSEINWDQINELVQNYKLEEHVVEHQYIINKIYAQNLPIDACELDSSRKATIEEKFFSLIEKGASSEGEGKGVIYLDHFKNIKGLRNKSRFICHEFFPSIEFMKNVQQYEKNKSLIGLYFRRLIKIFLKIIRFRSKL